MTRGADNDELDVVEQASAWCLLLAEGRFTGSTREAFDAWLHAAPGNVSAFDDVVRTWQILEQTHQSPELVSMRRAALKDFASRQAAREAGAGSWRRLGLAAAFGLAVLACVWAWQLPDRYHTGLGERRLVSLADGSSVSLDADSRVDVRLSASGRELSLRQGRVRFQVAHDPTRPFTVAAADKLVVAKGTEFSVELIDNSVHVILYEGKVEVFEEGRARPLEAVWEEGPLMAAAMMYPGTELVAEVALPSGRMRLTDPVRSLSWEAGQLAFSNEPLAAAVGRVNRYSRMPLRIADPAVAELRISGVFDAGDTQAFIAGVTGVLPVEVIAVNGELVFFPEDRGRAADPR